jgi:AraC-like DNA-binding protein
MAGGAAEPPIAWQRRLAGRACVGDRVRGALPIAITRPRSVPGLPPPIAYPWTVSREVEDQNRRLLRARDAMDRSYAEPLDVATIASVANLSPAHFIRCYRATFGETPHRYLQRRRVERSMFLLRETDRSVTDICLDVGFTSLGTFSRTFRAIVGETPTAYRSGHGPIIAPHCVQLAAMRPRFAAWEAINSSNFGEAPGRGRDVG